ncbi:acyl-CoA/acyl-ACP dehydrogenase [Paracoccus sp. YLB-12]|uniref:Acyl-CoA/acyl-ACP dehydrogenase n=1 Tax=Paracoccus maritimus TaxID=2933292 RepID=A0ABT2KEF0_9RHOB|nr:acyl-CoA dehydrogenase family protein [Paracoccus sp. YLB-12]MCT4334917.1 acyl-CoA/acyl-ACP dehydrogenase [Paracoccus sp. YLB-12]
MTDQAREILAAIGQFAAQQIAPMAQHWSKGQAPEPDLFRRAAELGLFRLDVAQSAGGLGLGFAVKARACQAMAAADFGFAMSLVNTHNVAARIVASASPQVQAAFLPSLLWGEASACTALTEPGAGSDVASLQTRAVRKDGGWLLNGEKAWIVNARHAATAIVYAQTEEHGDSSGIAAFLVDLTAQGCRRHASSSDFAQASAGTGGFTLLNVHLPDDHLLLPPGTAFGAIMSEINSARAYVAAMCCGMLDAALRHVSAYGVTRQSFGKPLRAHQAWRLSVARAETALAGACALTDSAIDRIDSGQDAQLDAAFAKIAATEALGTHMPVLLHAMGAEGLRPQYPMARHLAAAQIATLVDGSTEMLLERVARLARAHTET